ncbi:hypothetical protein [Rubrivirga sp.]|uniref:hypothetical protein n=1 Tax=Rubrivirga sp. TaxID=1885344 RepID=UPI003C7154F4
MRLAIFSSLLLLIASADPVDAQHQHAGVFAVEVGDADDGLIYRWRTRTAVLGWYHPTTEIGTPIRTVGAGRLVEGNDRSEALTVTRRAGRARPNGPSTIDVTNYGAATYLSRDAYYGSGRSHTLYLSSGDEIEWLARGAEGSEFFRFEGEVYSGWLPPSVERYSQPDTRLWVRLTPRGAGRPAAWINVDAPRDVERLESEYGG